MAARHIMHIRSSCKSTTSNMGVVPPVAKTGSCQQNIARRFLFRSFFWPFYRRPVLLFCIILASSVLRGEDNEQPNQIIDSYVLRDKYKSSIVLKELTNNTVTSTFPNIQILYDKQKVAWYSSCNISIDITNMPVCEVIRNICNVNAVGAIITKYGRQYPVTLKVRNASLLLCLMLLKDQVPCLRWRVLHNAVFIEFDDDSVPENPDKTGIKKE